MNAGRLSKKTVNVVLTGNAVKKHLGLELSVGEEALEAAAARMTVIGPRFFRAIKSLMVRNLELPHDIKEMGESQVLVLHTLTKGQQRTSDLVAALPGGRQGRGAREDRGMSDLSAPVLAVQDLHREFGGVHA